jgi:hypothetical protein
MSKFNTSSNYPLIQNSQEYMLEKEYISIHSEDRDIVKFPNASEFEIELPEDYYNVQSMCLNTWSFPIIHYNFSSTQYNTTLIVRRIPNIIEPSQTPIDKTITIPDGYYTSTELANELQNRLNSAYGGTDFIVVFNAVTLKFWFGNTTRNFCLLNASPFYDFNVRNPLTGKPPLYDAVNWGMPAYLGFQKQVDIYGKQDVVGNLNTIFYYQGTTSWLTGGLGSYYIEAPLKANLNGHNYVYMEVIGYNHIDETTPFTPNPFVNPSFNEEYEYTMHSARNSVIPCNANAYNNLDASNCSVKVYSNDTRPCSKSDNYLSQVRRKNLACSKIANTNQTYASNETSGIVNSAFAKIPITNAGYNTWYDLNILTSSVFNPPLERIRRLKFKFRYHNGSLADFGNSPFSFLLQLTTFRPQKSKTYKMYVPENMANMG